MSVSMGAGFSAGCWGPPLGGSRRLPRIRPTGGARRLRATLIAFCCSLALDDDGFVRGGMAIVRHLAGAHCNHTPSHRSNGALTPSGGRGRLLEAGLSLRRGNAALVRVLHRHIAELKRIKNLMKLRAVGCGFLIRSHQL
jgi:hypothetical protein